MDKLVTYFEVLKWASSFLENNGKESYIAEYLILEYHEWCKTDLLLNLKAEMPVSEKHRLKKDLEKVVTNYPPQYLIGSCEFYGERFLVSEATLIPRPETEELVDLCLRENTNKPQIVVDIGTGSGVIALSLKKHRQNWQVRAVDLSLDALEIAKKNAVKLEEEIHFFYGSTLEPIDEEQIDIIISNPPYISDKEWDVMDESVRNFEPKLALFADNDGLAIYEKIAKEAVFKLSKTGKIYLEIGYKQGDAIQQMYQHYFPDKKVRLVKDLAGQDRIIIVS